MSASKRPEMLRICRFEDAHPTLQKRFAEVSNVSWLLLADDQTLADAHELADLICSPGQPGAPTLTHTVRVGPELHAIALWDC